jgi:hypothetical protein
MCEQTGEEIDWDRCPPDLEDFPESIYTALNIFNSMGSRVQADIGYIGKDYTNLSLLYDFYYITEYEKDWIFELLLFLDDREIKESQRRMKSEMDRIKRS